MKEPRDNNKKIPNNHNVIAFDKKKKPKKFSAPRALLVVLFV